MQSERGGTFRGVMLRRRLSLGCRALATVLPCLALGPSLAQSPPPADAAPKSVRIQRTAEPPVIDGVLDEEIWQRAPLIADFHQVSPVEGNEPSERTEVYLLYDRDNLYIGARLYDSEPNLINVLILRQNQPIGSDDRNLAARRNIPGNTEPGHAYDIARFLVADLAAIATVQNAPRVRAALPTPKHIFATETYAQAGILLRQIAELEKRL
jgi:hypothetical protein